MNEKELLEIFKGGNCRIYSAELPGTDKQLLKTFQESLFTRCMGELPSDTYVHCIYPNLPIQYLETGDIVAVKSLVDAYISDMNLSVKPDYYANKLLLKVVFETMLDVGGRSQLV